GAASQGEIDTTRALAVDRRGVGPFEHRGGREDPAEREGGPHEVYGGQGPALQGFQARTGEAATILGAAVHGSTSEDHGGGPAAQVGQGIVRWEPYKPPAAAESRRVCERSCPRAA